MRDLPTTLEMPEVASDICMGICSSHGAYGLAICLQVEENKKFFVLPIADAKTRDRLLSLFANIFNDVDELP